MVTEALTMSLSSKREYLAKIHGRYQRAGRPHKSRILDEFCLNCGYHRKAALRLLRRPLQADNFGVHFKKLIWCLRREDGELTGRGHLHALIAGLPPHAMTTATCFSFMKIWEQLGGGMARVSLYSPLLDGVGYVLKGCEAEYARAGGDYYEARKFGGNCDVMLSESVFHVLEGRRQIGKRRRQGHRQAE
jgi:hypothetical protein